MSDQLWGIIVLLIGLAYEAYAVFAWRVGKVRAISVSTRADGPLSFWSGIVAIAAYGLVCLYAGIMMLVRW